MGKNNILANTDIRKKILNIIVYVNISLVDAEAELTDLVDHIGPEVGESLPSLELVLSLL